MRRDGGPGGCLPCCLAAPLNGMLGLLHWAASRLAASAKAGLQALRPPADCFQLWLEPRLVAGLVLLLHSVFKPCSFRI